MDIRGSFRVWGTGYTVTSATPEENREFLDASDVLGSLGRSRFAADIWLSSGHETRKEALLWAGAGKLDQIENVYTAAVRGAHELRQRVTTGEGRSRFLKAKGAKTTSANTCPLPFFLNSADANAAARQEAVPVDTLHLYPANARAHGPVAAACGQLAGSTKSLDRRSSNGFNDAVRSQT